MRRFALYSFVISLLWLGFVCASFIVAFASAPQLIVDDVDKALSVARVICMKSLNRAEWMSCAFCWLFILRIRIVRERKAVVVLLMATLALAFKSWFLLPPNSAVSIQDMLADNPYKTWSLNPYLVVQGAQTMAIGMLSAMSIQSFARAVISE
jgi:hypothetical protein